MAPNLIDSEQAARILGISVEEVNNLRERRELYGKRDGTVWKFNQSDIEQFKRDRDDDGGYGDSDSGELTDAPPELGDDLDSILLSEVELGKSPDSTTSTIIGKGKSPESSDIKIAGDKNKDEDAIGEGSDVELELDAASASGLKLVPGGSDATKGEDTIDDLDLGLDDISPAEEKVSLADSGLGMADSGLGLADSGLGLADSGLGLPGGSDVETTNDSGLGLADSGLNLSEGSDISMSDKKDKTTESSGLMGGSSLDLEAAEETVLGGSDSDITAGGGDSGIGVATPSDIGMSLESDIGLAGGSGTDMLELGDEDVVPGRKTDDDDVAELQADDEFLLSPSGEGAAEESDSGSQVIALDPTDDEFAVAGLGKTGTAVLEEEPAAPPPTAASATSLAPAGTVPDVRFSMANIVALGACVVFLMIGGMMAYDMVRNMWSWDQPYTVNSSIMDSLAKTFGW